MSADLRPFEIAVPQAVLDRIAGKVADSRIGYAPDDDSEWCYGTDARYLAEFVRYWRDRYDWRAAERELNKWPQFKVCIDGIDIHFQHIRGSGGGRPLILTHGWPGSIVEFQAAAERLAFPERFGGNPHQGFDLVIPSLPGFGWSGRPPRPIGPRAVATLWRKLMIDVLGYSRFGSQGGDWGASVTMWLGKEHQDVVTAIHLNLLVGPPLEPDDNPANEAYWQAFQEIQAAESAYMQVHRTKPQTIGLALHDHPVGAAAWIIEKFHRWADTHGDIESRFSKDILITNLMTYLVNDALISSFWSYRDILAETLMSSHITTPTGIAHYPAEFFPLPNRENAGRIYNVTHYAKMPRGGHFAAMEEPELFADDLRKFFSNYL